MPYGAMLREIVQLVGVKIAVCWSTNPGVVRVTRDGSHRSHCELSSVLALIWSILDVITNGQPGRFRVNRGGDFVCFAHDSSDGGHSSKGKTASHGESRSLRSD